MINIRCWVRSSMELSSSFGEPNFCRRPLNPSVVHYCPDVPEGFQGVTSIGHTWLPRGASLRGGCGFLRCKYSAKRKRAIYKNASCSIRQERMGNKLQRIWASWAPNWRPPLKHHGIMISRGLRKTEFGPYDVERWDHLRQSMWVFFCPGPAIANIDQFTMSKIWAWSLQLPESYTQSTSLIILAKTTKIKSYSPFFNWFRIPWNSVVNQIIRKKNIQILNLPRFKLRVPLKLLKNIYGTVIFKGFQPPLYHIK